MNYSFIPSIIIDRDLTRWKQHRPDVLQREIKKCLVIPLFDDFKHTSLHMFSHADRGTQKEAI